MPMSRYEIRNEYSLADPELYRAADKDDPEALLEGVAMAGLVGVLRQLGDLAEFAAEIFRDLHEEVMATAARGHGLMVRVQQLESEVPFIEKALISQTNHSSFFYNYGVDLHPNEKMDQNVITQGDLPRFVMDSYEECRGPPRLFLLDKFDIAGAGACLKRYTDPSFFKVEAPSSGMTITDVQREKRTRKAKKKGPRWRHGETPEVVYPTAHAKLHQLFLEEHVQNGVGNSARRVKLKRKLNGFPFNLKTGKSYMEKLFNTSSPEHKVVHEVPVRSPLKLPTNDRTEIVPKVLEVRTVSPDTENEGRERTPTSSPDGVGPTLQLSIYEPNEISADEKIPEVSKANPSYEADESSFSVHRATNENDIAVDEESKTEGSLDGYQSDDIASERDNYVDAPSTMDSEMDTDSERRGKSDLISLNIKRQLSTSDANEDQLQGHSSDSQSVVTSTLSDDGNNSSKKEMSSFSLSATPSTSAENSPSDRDAYAEVSLSTEIPETDTIDRSSHQQTGNGEVSVSQDPNAVVPDDTCFGIVEIPGHTDLADLNSSSCMTDVIPTSIHLDSESFVGNGRLSHPDEMSSTCNEITHEVVNTDHDGANVVKNLSCVSSSLSAAQMGDDSSPRLSTENHLIDESNGIMSENVAIMSTISHDHCHARDNSRGHLDGNDSDVEDLSLHENIDQLHTVSTENMIPCMVDKEFPDILENSMSDHSDTISQQNDGCIPIASEEKHSVDELDDKNQNVFSNACNNLSYIREAASEKENTLNSLDDMVQTVGENTENSLDDMVQTVGVSVDYPCSFVDSQFRSPNLVSAHTEENSFYLPQIDFELHDAGNIVASADQMARNDVEVVESPKSSDSSVLQATGIKDNDYPPDVADIESSHASEKNLDEPVTTSNAVDVDGTDGTDITVFVDPTSLKEVNVEVNGVDTEADRSVPAVKSSTVSATENNSDVDGLEVDGVNNCTDLNAKDATDITVSPHAASLNDVQAQLDAMDTEADRSVPAVKSSTVSATENNSDVDGVEADGVNICTDLNAKDATDITVSPLAASLNEVQAQLDAMDTEADRSVPAVKSSTVSATENNSNVDGVEVDGVNICTDLNAKDATDITVSPHAASLNEVQAQLDAMDSEEDQSDAAVMATIVSDDSNEADVSSSVDLKKSQEECACSLEFDQNSFGTEMKCLPDSFEESGLAKDVVKQEAATSGSNSVLCSSPVDYDHSKSELLASVPHRHSDSEVENGLDTFDAGPTQSSPEQNCLAVEHESCQQGGLIDQLEDASTVDIHHNAEKTSVEGKINLLTSHTDLEELPGTGEENYEQVLRSKEVQNLDHNAPEGSSDNTSDCFVTNIQNQPSVLEIPVQSSSDVDMSVYPKDTLVSTLPPLGLLSEANPINLDELPPLPPLPPVQWRMGKLQHASAPGRVAAQENVSPILSALPMVANQNTQKPILPASAVRHEDSPPVQENSSGNIVQAGSLSSQVPHVYHPSNTENYSLVLGGNQSMNSFSMLPERYDETPQDSVLLGKGSMAQSRITSFSQDASMDTASTNDIGLSHEVLRSLHPVAPEISSKEEKVESSSSGVEVNTTRPETVELLPKIPALVMPSSEGENTLPHLEDGVTNGSRTMKQPRPRNPLIDAVVANDKSKLRKVTERVMPEIQKVDERDSLLEQIRAKSFNLKPAAVTRPSIQGPKTNLKVAAILEKANAIRQAFVGSDDDDDDSWSDS